MHLPPLLMITISLLSLTIRSSALPPSPPSQPQPFSLLLPSDTNTNTTTSTPGPNPGPRPRPRPPPERRTQCFHLGTEDVHPVDTDDCRLVIDVILHEPPGAMTPHKFGHVQTPPDPSIYLLPSAWRIQECVILLSSLDEGDVGDFRFVDVAEMAMRVLRECCETSKSRLGGVATLGIKSFFISVDGPPGGIGGPGRNGTMARAGGAGGGSGANVDSTLASRRFLA